MTHVPVVPNGSSGSGATRDEPSSLHDVHYSCQLCIITIIISVSFSIGGNTMLGLPKSHV